MNLTIGPLFIIGVVMIIVSIIGYYLTKYMMHHREVMEKNEWEF